MTRFCGLAAFVLSVAMPPVAFAQEPPAAAPRAPLAAQSTFSALPDEPEGLTVTPFIGLGFAGDFENAPTAFGVAAGYGIGQRLTVEGDLYFAPGGEQGELVEFETSLWSVSANLLYHFTGEYVTPYVAGGLGVMGADAAGDLGLADDTSTEFAWNWGGGVKSALSDRFALRADLRFFNGDELVPDHWRLFGGVTIRNIGR
jgi:opacity protein-like surface antigen